MGRKLPRPFDRETRVVADDPHPECDTGVGHDTPDGAETDYAECAPGQFVTGEMFLTGLNRLVQLLVRTLEIARKIPRLTDVPAAKNETGDHKLFDGIGIRTRRVEHRRRRAPRP